MQENPLEEQATYVRQRLWNSGIVWMAFHHEQALCKYAMILPAVFKDWRVISIVVHLVNNSIMFVLPKKNQQKKLSMAFRSHKLL